MTVGQTIRKRLFYPELEPRLPPFIETLPSTTFTFTLFLRSAGEGVMRTLILLCTLRVCYVEREIPIYQVSSSVRCHFR